LSAQASLFCQHLAAQPAKQLTDYDNLIRSVYCLDGALSPEAFMSQPDSFSYNSEYYTEEINLLNPKLAYVIAYIKKFSLYLKENTSVHHHKDQVLNAA
jgi:hypothetical protein